MSCHNTIKSNRINLNLNLTHANNHDYKNKSNNEKNLVGSVIKGPMDGAIIKLKDAHGALVASTTLKKGAFSFNEQNFTSEYYTIESVGGIYDDEASEQITQIGLPQGLCTLLSNEKIQTIVKNKESITITPATTIFTALVLSDISNGINLDNAITEAYLLVTLEVAKNLGDILIA